MKNIIDFPVTLLLFTGVTVLLAIGSVTKYATAAIVTLVKALRNRTPARSEHIFLHF